MNIALRKPMTVDEYLAWADTQSEQVRSELINGQVVAMTPERVEHVEVKVAAVSLLTEAIKRAGVACFALGDGMTVRIDAHTAYEPDALVYCGNRLPRGSVVVPDPIIVVEVLSPTTEHQDLSAKLIGYFKLASVRHYLIIDPNQNAVTHCTRDAGGEISKHTASDGTLRFDPPGVEIEVTELFS